MKLPEAQKTVLFKRGLPKYIKRYIKQEKPTTLRDTLIRAKEAEELGEDHDADEDIKGLQESMTMLLSKLDKPSKPSVSALANNNTGLTKCIYCQQPGHLLNNCPVLHGEIKHINGTGNVEQASHNTTPVTEKCMHCHIPGHSMNECRKF